MSVGHEYTLTGVKADRRCENVDQNVHTPIFSLNRWYCPIYRTYKNWYTYILDPVIVP